MRRGCHPLTAYEAMHALHSDETLRNHFLFYGAHRVHNTLQLRKPVFPSVGLRTVMNTSVACPPPGPRPNGCQLPPRPVHKRHKLAHTALLRVQKVCHLPNNNAEPRAPHRKKKQKEKKNKKEERANIDIVKIRILPRDAHFRQQTLR
jgi:hypothetical protein